MKKHHVAPSHELIWATGVTDVTRNVAHLQPSNTSSLESLIHWLSSGCQIWSWGDLWQNVSRKHEWQLEWTAWNEQGWNRCLQQQNATNTFIYLAGSCVHMHIYIYIIFIRICKSRKILLNDHPTTVQTCLLPQEEPSFVHHHFADLFSNIQQCQTYWRPFWNKKKLPTPGPSQGSASDWLLRLLSVSNTLLSHWPSWCAHSESPCGKLMVSVRFSCGKSLGSWCAMEGVSLEENQWEIKFHQVIIWEQGCTNKLYIYISKEAGLFQTPTEWYFPYRRSCWHSAWCLLTSNAAVTCSHSRNKLGTKLKFPPIQNSYWHLAPFFPKYTLKNEQQPATNNDSMAKKHVRLIGATKTLPWQQSFKCFKKPSMDIRRFREAKQAQQDVYKDLITRASVPYVTNIFYYDSR